MKRNVPSIVKRLSLKGLMRIDLALEGNWSPTVITVWTKQDGFIGFQKVRKSHKIFKPSLELYFESGWVGVHCYKRIKNKNVFDKFLASQIINFVEKKMRRR